ncbi:hypothetical protein E1176_19495 [Fulvivirga sp. RKSG066]|uniref:hypothetical protein n=1 Tax=Fulvivirga aurantia TaxID=2529383 RepID=UPI0012BD7F72|nr:hypothetical protein [Fulvivirga aurantia]MTI23222.1 hypothetical protein [Fulvivirga aurantia]
MNKLIIAGMLCFITVVSLAQTQEEKILQQVRDQEHAKNAALMRKMDQGVDLMNAGDNLKAEEIFKTVLKQSKIVPTDLCFYFGKNSYQLDKYQQSIDWLNKYIEIKGTTGRFYEESISLLELAKEQFLKVRNTDRKEAQTVFSLNYEVDCGPTGKVVCPVCQGEGVIISQGAFGRTYKHCPYSDEHGLLTCEQYNQLLRGELKANNQ